MAEQFVCKYTCFCPAMLCLSCLSYPTSRNNIQTFASKLTLDMENGNEKNTATEQETTTERSG